MAPASPYNGQASSSSSSSSYDAPAPSLHDARTACPRNACMHDAHPHPAPHPPRRVGEADAKGEHRA
eukprot:10484395-Alexandrium_andersonii.AAC.1